MSNCNETASDTTTPTTQRSVGGHVLGGEQSGGEDVERPGKTNEMVATHPKVAEHDAPELGGIENEDE